MFSFSLSLSSGTVPTRFEVTAARPLLEKVFDLDDAPTIARFLLLLLLWLLNPEPLVVVLTSNPIISSDFMSPSDPSLKVARVLAPFEIACARPVADRGQASVEARDF